MLRSISLRHYYVIGGLLTVILLMTACGDSTTNTGTANAGTTVVAGKTAAANPPANQHFKVG